MSTVSLVSSGTPDPSTQLASSANSALGKDDFLKLFVAQLQHQDPSSPMDANQSMEQMATFSMVEQLTNLSSEQAKIAQNIATSSAVGLIGRTVTYTDAAGSTQAGAVERVSTVSGKTRLFVAGTEVVGPSSVTQGL